MMGLKKIYNQMQLKKIYKRIDDIQSGKLKRAMVIEQIKQEIVHGIITHDTIINLPEHLSKKDIQMNLEIMRFYNECIESFYVEGKREEIENILSVKGRNIEELKAQEMFLKNKKEILLNAVNGNKKSNIAIS